jgi:TonB family protein
VKKSPESTRRPSGAADTRRLAAYAPRPYTALLSCLALTAAFAPVASAQAQAPEQGAAEQGADTPTPAPGTGVVPPRLLQFVEADYPAEAQAAGMTADVVLRLRIEADGSVSEAEVMSPAGHGFDEAAVAAARRFVFAPALNNGQPVAVRIPFKYSFTLTEQPAAEQPAPTHGDVLGRVQIAGTETPLVGARVTLSNAAGQTFSAITAPDGSWSLQTLPPGRYQVRVEADGFSSVDLPEDVTPGEITELTYRLTPDLGDVIEVSVFGTRPPREVLRRTITRREMTRVPGSSGDALRSLQNLPGLARPPGLAGLLIVRGSAPEDSAVFVDGDTVPFIYHFGGLSSAIPTELLERIDFYPGNFSARYGRVMGGIVDVALRSPDTSCQADYGQPSSEQGCFHGLAQLDLIDARLLVQGPLPIDGWSFAIGGRRSWVDLWLKPVLREAGAGVTTAPVYHDYQIIAETRPSSSSRFSLRFFGSDDALEVLIENPSAQDPGAFGGNLRFGTSFYRLQSVLEADLSRDVSLTSLVSVGRDKASFGLGRFLFDAISYPIQTRNEISWTFARGMTLNAGLDFQIVPFDLLARLPEPPRPGEPAPGPFTTRPLLETNVQSTFFRPAWYADALLRFGRLNITPGLRVDYARDTGHADLSPRLAMRYDLSLNAQNEDGSSSRRTTLKAAAGLFHQPAQPQETDEIFGTPGLSSNRATHYSVGVERELTDNVELNVEGFYKDLDQLVARSAGLDGTFAYDNRGSGYVVGGETLLKYKADARFFGWLAYTLSRSMRRDRPDAETYPFQFDQTHILTVLGSYKLGRGWEAGARFRVVSGPLDTPASSFPDLPALFAADAAAYTPLQGAPFSERLPLFHQLDLRVEKNWQFRDFRLTFFVDVWNAYNNASAEAISYNFDYSRRTYQQGLPIIPSLGFRGEL